MVLGESMLLIGGAPTSAALMPPLPASPWHIAHFCAKTGAPCAMVPLPGGKPWPSGYAWISHAAISACVTGLPRFGPAASAGVQARKRSASLCIDMAHLALAVDRPARNAVVVLARETEHVRHARRLAAHRNDFAARRLHVALVIPGAALQYGGTAVPLPRHAKAGEGLRHHRLLQRRLRPGLAAVGGHHHLRDAAGAGVGDARDLVEARALHREAVRGPRDEGLHLLHEVEAVCLAVWQDRRISARLVVAHRRLGGELEPAQPLHVHVAFPA